LASLWTWTQELGLAWAFWSSGDFFLYTIEDSAPLKSWTDERWII
jgi:hypothetical protein